MNTEFKGTKGEWQTCVAISQMSKKGTIDIISEDILSVGVPTNETVDGNLLVALCGNKNREDVKANAQLIATSPELLEALKDCIEYLRKADGTMYHNCANRAEKAIQKALNP